MTENHVNQLDAEQLPEQNGDQVPHQESRNRPGTFTRGDKRINKNGPRPKEEDASDRSDVPQLLRDMRRVTRTKASADRTDFQKRLWRLYHEDFKGFTRQMTQSERAFMQSRGKQAKSGAAEPSLEDEPEEIDAGKQSARDLIARVFERFEREQSSSPKCSCCSSQK
jgi:hypothetical protein